jgi:hypothetical protein
MGRRCADRECPNSGNTRVGKEKIHKFPSIGFLQRDEWISRTVSDNEGRNLEHFGVCQRHFNPQDYRKWKETDGEGFVKAGWLKEEAVPTLHLDIALMIPDARERMFLDNEYNKLRIWS